MRNHPELDRILRRRAFLGVAAGATAAALVGAAAGPAAALDTASGAAPGRHRPGGPLLPPGRLGIQLYTLRDQIASIGFGPVFEHLSRYGYDEIEYAGYTQGAGGEITLRQLRRLARDNGLRGIGSHVGYYSDDPDAYTFAGRLQQVLDDAEELGLRHIGTASAPFRYGDTVDAWKRAAEEFNTYGAAARERGMKFYQHNHTEEFSFASDRPDVRLYDVLLAETDPELVYLEMDIYWAYCGQYRYSVRPDGLPAPFEPIDYVLRAPHRYPLFHVKDGEHDETASDGYRMVDVGDGDIDYRSFIGGVERLSRHTEHHWLVEHDQPEDPLRTARRSATYLRSLRRRR
ncbi:sugar phosphate isomerase/epimerase family protein [Streptomyces sp. TP-A0874]|uniref:sugar phosphate isomerase/epimerase family protein n=1 Tax=Streptomyces sp. TP-A0874 TaxID=549819 RepID=UPI000853844C|nr:sugar phosphate isomerase/epimerase [Streptomyces sp. TP-A0874]